MSTRVGDYNHRLAANRDAYLKSMEEAKKHYKSRLENYKEANEKRRAKNVRLFRSELEEKEKIVRDKIRKVDENSLLALKRRNEKYNKNLKDFKRKTYEYRMRKKKEFGDQLERVSDSFRSSIKSNDTRHKDVQNEIRKRLEHINARDRRVHHRDIKRQHELFSDRTKQLRDFQTKQTRDLVRTHQDREEDFLYQQEIEDQERRIKFTRKLDDYKIAHESEVDSLKSSLLDASRDKRMAFVEADDTVKNIKDKYDRRLKDINSALDGQVFNMRKAHEREMELTSEHARKEKLVNLRAFDEKKTLASEKHKLDMLHEMRLDRLRDYIYDQEAGFVQDKHRTAKNHQNSFRKQKSVINDKMTEKNEFYENLLGEVDIRNRKKNIQKDDAFQNRLRDLQVAHREDVNLLEQNNKHALKKQRDAHSYTVKKLNKRAIKSLNDFKKEISTDRDYVIRGTERDLYEISKAKREEFVRKLEDIIAKYEENMANKEEMLKNTTQRYEKKLRIIKKKFQSQLKIMAQMQKEYRKVEKEQNKNALKELRDDFQQKITKQRMESDDKIKNIKDRQAIQVTELVQKAHNEKIALRLQHQKEMKSKLRNLRKAYEQNVKNNEQLRLQLEKSYEERLKNLRYTLKRHYKLQSIREKEQASIQMETLQAA